MADEPRSPAETLELFAAVLGLQVQTLSDVIGGPDGADPLGATSAGGVDWVAVCRQVQGAWRAAQADIEGETDRQLGDPAQWLATAQHVLRQLPLARPETQKHLWEEGLALAETVLGQYGIGPKAGEAGPDGPELPRSDRRFADPQWREKPLFALLHQVYLLLAERTLEMADAADGLAPGKRHGLAFAARALTDALSPANFPFTNPVVLDRAAQTGGQSLVRGMEHLFADLRRGQLTHADREAFTLGENIAATPGKVVHRTALFELIQYSPTTDKVLRTPLVIFPAWINRFYILDLGPQKSFVRWAVEQGVTVFMVSWKSADETMSEVTWDDYVAAQIEAMDLARERLKVPCVHTLGYCVAGTTLAATLAVLARRDEAAKVKSATFLTAQVDFEEAGEIASLVDDAQIQAVERLGEKGYVDGRHLSATFNLLRGNDLIWTYVVNNYLKGEDYPAFDMLYWNGDYTNLPVAWFAQALRDLYRDNLLIEADALSVCGTPIDLRRIETPSFIQAGKEDHIAPPHSVWKLTRQLGGPRTFLLAASGHIAGVVNPPASGKYPHWTNEAPAATFEDFLAGATEHPGSWWTRWFEWLRAHDDKWVATRGKRRPGGRGDRVLGDAPGDYVRTR